MDFEQLKVIWDAQNAAPLYAINEAELHAIVERRNREFNRCDSRRYGYEMACSVFFGALLAVLAGVAAFDPAWATASFGLKVSPTLRDAAALLLAGGLIFYYAAYVFRARQNQKRREEDFASTLRGDLDRALARVAFETHLARGILWRGLLPLWTGSLLLVITIFRLIGTRFEPFLVSAAVIAVALSIALERRRIKRRYEPRRQELENLRAKLSDPQS